MATPALPSLYSNINTFLAQTTTHLSLYFPIKPKLPLFPLHE